MQEIKIKLVNIMKDLSEKDRLIMVLYYYENLTAVDIGKILNIKEKTVSKHIQRILKIIKPRMEKK